MVWLVLVIAFVAGLRLLWLLESAPVEPHGLDSLDVPPPVPYDGPLPPRDFED